jgi:NTP pyrophosphatase (non-canonical NTP hydrolase)
MDLRTLQDETREWLAHNFPGQEPHQPLLGIVEEVGELAHARLKHEQAIRGYDIEKSRSEIEDAIGDIQVFLAGFCNTNGYDLDEIVTRVWADVKTRDWVAHPETGRPPEDAR